MFFQNNELKEKAEELKGLGDKIIALQKDQETNRSLIGLLFDQTPALIFFKDDQNNIVNINQYGCKLWGYEKEDLLGDKWQSTAVEGVDLEKFLDNDLDVITTGKPKMNIIEPLVNDSSRIFMTHKVPVRRDGKIIGILGFSTEITEPLAECENGR